MNLPHKHDMSEDTVEHLSELIQINKDSVEGFEEAIKAANDSRVETLFREVMDERKDFAAELAAHVDINDGNEDPSGSIKGMAHRWWLQAHAAFASNNAIAVLKDAEAGEDEIKEKYEEVLKETAGSPVNDVLTRQYAKVKAGHDRIRDLRDAYVKADG